jgi:septal ring factor EnvC (AmiA/AmiB activator)
MLYWKKIMPSINILCPRFRLLPLCIGILCCFSLPAESENLPAVAQTQTKLKQLDAKIKSLQHTLASANDKRGALNHELSGTEKKIGEGVLKLYSIQGDINQKEHKIDELKHKVNELNTQLTTQQELLASHVRARYQMGEYQPLKWVLNQDEPSKISRILTYYQYIVKSRQHLIEQIDITKKELNTNQEKLHTELAATHQLKNQLTQNQRHLEQNKSYHTTLIHTLNNQIQSNQHALEEFQKDKNNLSRLLKTLSQQSVVQNSRPFGQMRKKLPRPIQAQSKSLQRMNQGVTFFADEGAVVTAIYPGKVVFSDWLKGYGLLLIIDHGQGFMTLYAHNQSLFKHKGEPVRQNEQIASVGHSGGIKQNGLYFEIRVRGKAVSPLDWLA